MNSPKPNIIRDVAENYAQITMHIEDAARAAGRSPCEVTLIAVGKRQPLDRIERALHAGHRVFGETAYKRHKANGWR